MGSLGSTWSLADAMAPLTSKFGDRLTLCRDGGVVQWTFDGQTVSVELGRDGTVQATFVDRPVVDAVSATLASAVYHRSGNRGYRVSADGCTRMVSDMVDFFTGTREPRFTFITAYEQRQAS